MNTKQYNLLTLKLAIAVLLILANLGSSAQTAPVSVNPSGGTKLSFIAPPLPNRGLPKGRARGGASRSEMCQATAQPLTALVPSQQVNSTETAGGLTIAASPTLWFYVPYAIQNDDLVEFVLQDEQHNTIYQTTLKVSQLKASVVGVPLPKTLPPLAQDRMYHWYFLVYCEPDSPVFVEGWIERVSINSDLERQIEQASPRERIALLAANGIWYDALTQLVQMRALHPDDTTLAQDWESLLESAGLSMLVTEPIERLP
jgi:Domain of Unknown Function (DUF928)